MKRRTLLAGFGALSASGVSVVGSGAFSTVRADRSVSLQVARDSDAFLKLVPRGSGYRSREGEDLVTFMLPAPSETVDTFGVNPENPQGLGEDSVYRFGSDVNGSTGLLAITNQGTQSVDIWGAQKYGSETIPEVGLFEVASDSLLTASDPYTDLGPGESIAVGLEIDTFGVDTRESAYQLTLSIVAEAPEVE